MLIINILALTKKNMTSNNKRLKYCIITNFALLFIIMLMIIIFRDNNDKYLKFGPNNDLIIMSIKIDNYKKYIILQIFLCFIEIISVIVNEIGLFTK